MLSVVSLNAQDSFPGLDKKEVIVENGKAVLDDVTVTNVRMDTDGKFITVDMDFILSEISMKSKRALLLVPRIVNGKDMKELPAVGVYGRQRWYFNLRNDETVSGKQELQYRKNRQPDLLPYHGSAGYEPWMNGAKIAIYRLDYGCCNNLLAEQAKLLGAIREAFYPEFIYVRPEADTVKLRHLAGTAFVDFPVDQTVIYPEYRDNKAEIGKIVASIDTVRNDSDVTITSVWLKGFASPESPYAHNTDLAVGRTAALKKYILELYNFDNDIIRTEYEPENWEGLRRYVEESEIAHRQEILAIIDSDEAPDPKEDRLKKTWPEEYRFLLRNCYPALRRTDYRIDYTVRVYNDIEEIRRIMASNPQNLSLNEFYLLALEYEPGTQEFTDVFETAVRMFPNDGVANLNAANAAMGRGDFKSAERYLKKAGDMPESVYARGVYAYLTGDTASAETCFREAEKMGLEAAKKTLEEMAGMK